MRKLLSLLTIFAIVLSCSSDETSTPVTPPPAPIAKYTITLSAGEGGTVSTTGGEYESGQTVSVTATPQGEYVFKNWSDGNTNATRTITVSSNSTLTANFEKRKYPLTINFEGEGEVIEEIVNAGRTTEYDSGTTVKLTAQAAAEWIFVGWTGDIESTEESVQIVIGEPKEVTATFEKKKYPLTVNIEGEGEVLEEIVNAGRTTDYDSGTTVKLTAVPYEGWEFVGWTGAIASAELEIEILVSEAKTISATFSLITNASDYNPVNQTVTLNIYDLIGPDEYGYPIYSESPTIITVPVISVEGSRHKIYNPEPDSYKIIELDIENNVVYQDNGDYYMVTHETLPEFKTQVITPSGLNTTIRLDYFESFTFGEPLYEYIADYSKHIQGKELIAVKQKIIGYGDEPVWTPYYDDIAWRSGKLRHTIYGGEGLSDLAYSKMDSMVYNIELDKDVFKDIKIKYEVNLYENEDEIISELNPYDGGDGGFDEMVKGMQGTDAAKYLEEIYLLGGREYFAAATGGSGVIKFLYPGVKTRDLLTHEMGHVWQFRSHIGIPSIDQNEWNALYDSGVFVSNYGMDNPGEFFAEAFMIYWNPNFNNPNITNPDTGETQYTLPASVEAKLDSYFKN
ncbi:InlB B-repeat-containing protein [Flavobacteriaceae bacterium]|nr:InlB B-repeat-containing protein [Flavobacteriaceae bacterium]MDC1364191.1 InlB B-repeat-containing protein [Flavobacteriaceae bacterium]